MRWKPTPEMHTKACAAYLSKSIDDIVWCDAITATLRVVQPMIAVEAVEKYKQHMAERGMVSVPKDCVDWGKALRLPNWRELKNPQIAAATTQKSPASD